MAGESQIAEYYAKQETSCVATLTVGVRFTDACKMEELLECLSATSMCQFIANAALDDGNLKKVTVESKVVKASNPDQREATGLLTTAAIEPLRFAEGGDDDSDSDDSGADLNEA